MNLALLLVGARVWASGPIDAFARATAAIAVLSLEMQVVTLTGVGSLSSLVLLNAAAAIVGLVVARRSTPSAPRTAAPSDRARSTALPWMAIVGMAAVALVLATRPLAGADPYHLDRVAQILRLGTLEFDQVADIKVNVLASSYELVLADLRQVPVIGGLLLRLHALVSLAYFTLGVAAIRQWLPGGTAWCWTAVFVPPVVFHQLAFVKNDLYSATPALVALVWLAVRVEAAPLREVAAVSALAGFAVAMKWVAFPLGLLMAAGIGCIPRARGRRLAGTGPRRRGGGGGRRSPLHGGPDRALVRASLRTAGGARQPHHRRGRRAHERDALRDQPVRLRVADAALVARPGRVGRHVRRAPRVGDGGGGRALADGDGPAHRGDGRTLWGACSRRSTRTPTSRTGWCSRPGSCSSPSRHSTPTARAPTATWLRRALAAALTISAVQIARSLWIYLAR